MRGVRLLLFMLLFLTDANGFAPVRTLTHTSPRHSHWQDKSSRVTGGQDKALYSLLVTLRGGGLVNDAELAKDAFEWCANLGAPAALVAGAVLATLAETRGDMSPRKNDKSWIRFAKKSCRFLLLSAFALEIISIFATTVTGTMLMSHGDRPAGTAAGIAYHSAMGFLRYNHEFEYMTARVTFLQGLFNWLTAVAFEVIIPKEEETVAARKMNYFISSSLISIILLMLSFYNNHMTFYKNYLHMLSHYVVVTFKRFVWHWPPRPMSFLVVPSFITSCILGYQAFRSPADLDE